MGSYGGVTRNCVKYIRPVRLKWGKSFNVIGVQRGVSWSPVKCVPFNRTGDCTLQVRGVVALFIWSFKGEVVSRGVTYA